MTEIDSSQKSSQSGNQISQGSQEKLEPASKEKITASITQFAESQYYSGPVMPPQMLAEIEQIIPGGANRVLQLTEKEQTHRHKIEVHQNEVFGWQAKLSLFGGLAAFFSLIAGIIFCAANEYSWGVGSLAVISAFGVVSHIIRVPSHRHHQSTR